MNERIKKLNYQALCDVMNGPDPDGDVEQMYIPAEFTKKFAELIVRECAEVANKNRTMMEIKTNTHLTADAIKEHFRVKE
jgi:hypothetical protein